MSAAQYLRDQVPILLKGLKKFEDEVRETPMSYLYAFINAYYDTPVNSVEFYRGYIIEQRELICKQAEQIKRYLAEISYLYSRAYEAELRNKELQTDVIDLYYSIGVKEGQYSEAVRLQLQAEMQTRSTYHILSSKIRETEELHRRHYYEMQVKDRLLAELEERLEYERKDHQERFKNLEVYYGAKIASGSAEREVLQNNMRSLTESYSQLYRKYDYAAENSLRRTTNDKALINSYQLQIDKLRCSTGELSQQVYNLSENLRQALRQGYSERDQEVRRLAAYVAALSCSKDELRQQILAELGDLDSMSRQVQCYQAANQELHTQASEWARREQIYQQQVSGLLGQRRERDQRIGQLQRRVAELEGLLAARDTDGTEQYEPQTEGTRALFASQMLEDRQRRPGARQKAVPRLIPAPRPARPEGAR